LVDWDFLADLLDREIERVNSVVGNSVASFRKNTRAHIANMTQRDLTSEAVDALKDVQSKCEELARHLDQHGLLAADDATQSHRRAARLAAQRLRGLRAN
jgi:hypothetical protein